MNSCPQCGEDEQLQRRGIRNNRQRFECQECGCWFSGEIELEQKIKSPKILLWDIENSGMLVENVWNLFEPRLNYSQVVGDAFILSWSAKWLYDDKMYSDVVTPNEVKNRDDMRVVSSLYRMLDDADIIVGHNIDGHDIPKVNSRLIYYGINPPMYDRSIDSYKVAKSLFSFPSNSLDNINKYLGLEEKVHNNPGLWEKCVHDADEKSLHKLKKYNEQDALCVEALYLRMLPWIKNHPNWIVYGQSMDGETCPQCGKSGNIEWRDDKLNKGIYRVARCTYCGAPIRSSIKEGSKSKGINIFKRI